MRLLIVDDQASVVEGLLKGVYWADIKIDEVFTALNALEAKSVLKRQQVDIVLCDIEMPVESGLDLLHWIKDCKIPVLFIFLTSHAEFAFAQNAIRLGAFDYIIQPAPYEEVSRVVAKAVTAVEQQREQKETLNHGILFGKQKKSFVGNAVRNFLKGRGNKSYLQSLTEMELLPHLDGEGYLVLLHVVKWNTATEVWESDLLEVSLENVVSEIFEAQNHRTALAFVEENTFAVLVQPKEGAAMTQQLLMQQLQFLCSVCTEYFKCSIACFFAPPDSFANAQRHWELCLQERDNNVLLKAGVFPKEKAPDSAGEHIYRVPQVKHWGRLLQDGLPQVVEQEALGLLDEMVEKDRMDHVVLRHFYQDFIQMINHTLDAAGKNLRDIFPTAEEMELYRNGMKSVEQMKALISFASYRCTVRAEAEDTRVLIQRVVDYIDAHLEDELRRDELAETVHLNPDYLSRIFKKEMGVTLKEYITEHKMRAAQGLLKTTSLPVSFVAAKMGYCSFSHFSSTYKKIMGVTPQEERQ